MSFVPLFHVVAMSGRSRRDADGMELFLSGLIGFGVGVTFLVIPISLFLMNSDSMQVAKPMLHMFQTLIPTSQIIIQGLLLCGWVFATSTMLTYILLIVIMMLIYLRSQTHWISIFEELW